MCYSQEVWRNETKEMAPLISYITAWTVKPMAWPCLPVHVPLRVQVVINDAEQGVSNDPTELQNGGAGKLREGAVGSPSRSRSSKQASKYRQPGILDVLDAMDGSTRVKEP